MMIAQGNHRTRFAGNGIARCDIALVAGMLLAPLGACETKVRTNDGRPMPPDPRPAPQTPPEASANAIALRVGPKPRDTNGNGFPDQIQIEAYLFAQPFPSPIHQHGSFIFELYATGQSTAPGVEPMRSWRVEKDDLDSRRTRTLYGPGYLLVLSLLEGGSDQYPLIAADLVCRFEPEGGGAAVQGSGVYTLQLGRQTAGAVPIHSPQ
jgi:hypothetical protein